MQNSQSGIIYDIYHDKNTRGATKTVEMVQTIVYANTNMDSKKPEPEAERTNLVVHLSTNKVKPR